MTLGVTLTAKPMSSIKQDEDVLEITEKEKSGTTVNSTVSMLVHPPERFDVTS